MALACGTRMIEEEGEREAGGRPWRLSEEFSETSGDVVCEAVGFHAYLELVSGLPVSCWKDHTHILLKKLLIEVRCTENI